jgi:hypothetical protein
VIYGKSVVFARAPENKEEQGEARDDVTSEIVERIVQQMPKGHDDEDETKRDQRVACSQSKDDERAGDEFDERNRRTDGPERPDRQESVGERQEIFSCVLDRPQLKNFPEAGHEENEAENESSEEQGPGAQISIHRFRRFSQIEDETGKQEKRRDDLETMKPGETFPAFLIRASSWLPGFQIKLQSRP